MLLCGFNCQQQLPLIYYLLLILCTLKRKKTGSSWYPHHLLVVCVIAVTEYEIERGMLTADDPANTTFCITRNISNLEENINHKRAAKFIDLVPSTVSSQPPTQTLIASQRPSADSHPKFMSPMESHDGLPRYESTSGSASPLSSPGTEQRFIQTLNVPSLTIPAPNKLPKTIPLAVLYAISTPGIRTHPPLLFETKNGVPPLSPSESKMEIDRDAQKMLLELQHDKIRHVLPRENLEHFDIKWTNPEETNPTENSVYLQHFMDTFETQMLKLIERAVRKQKSIARNSHIVEILQHLTMCRQRSQVSRAL